MDEWEFYKELNKFNSGRFDEAWSYKEGVNKGLEFYGAATCPYLVSLEYKADGNGQMCWYVNMLFNKRYS